MFQSFIHSLCFLLLFSKTGTSKQVSRVITGNVMDKKTQKIRLVTDLDMFC